MRVMFYRVLLELVDPVKQTSGGIMLPEDAVEDRKALTTIGKVVDVGPLAFSARTRGDLDFAVHKEDVKPGAFAMIARYGGQNWTDRKTGKRFTIVNDNELLAVLEEPEVANFVEVY